MQIIVILLISILSIILSVESYGDDVVKLKNGDVFSGELTDSDKPSIYSLDSAEALGILKIKEESIGDIVFSQSNRIIDHDNTIVLINGDYFPCELESLDESSVTFNTDYMGRQILPRNMVRNISFGEKIIYISSGKDLADWESEGNWEEGENGFSCSKSSELTKTISKLPENFSVDFRIAWTDEDLDFRFFLGQEMTAPDKDLTCYYLQIHSEGFRIKYGGVNNSFVSIGSYDANGKITENKEAKVSLYVDRRNKKIALYLNDKKVIEVNHQGASPTGSSFIFYPVLARGNSMTIKSIKVSNWYDDIKDSSNPDGENLVMNDIVTDIKGNIRSGKLVRLVKKNGQFLAEMNRDIGNGEPRRMMSNLKVIDLQKRKKVKPILEGGRIIRLSDKAILTCDTARFKDGGLVATHAILGKVKIDRCAITQLVFKEVK